MRLSLLIVIACVFGALAASANANTRLEEFRARLEAALAIENEAERLAAMGALFYRGALDDWSENLAELAIGRLAQMHGREVSFAPLSPKRKTVRVRNSYEYRPNLEPLGYVVFTDPAAAPGNNTKVLYGLQPEEARYYIPLTVRRQVNPDAPSDKQLQMITIGMAHPPVTFEGWCDIALSNNTIRRVTLNDNGVGNQTRFMHGQSIEACDVTNTSGRGSLSLRLYEDGRTVFERRIGLRQKRFAQI